MAEKDKELQLQKAKAKSLAGHFKKVAAYHDTQSSHHEKMAAAHKAHAEHHEGMMGKAEDAHHAHHKASASFHKAMAGHHEKVAKAHASHADHYRAMADAHAEGDAESSKKALQLLGIDVEETPLSKTPEPIAPRPVTAAPTTPAVVDPAAVVPPANFSDQIQKALDVKLTEAVDAAFERVLNSEDFSKRVDQEVAKKMLEQLGSSTVPTEIRTFPVPRPTASSNGNKSASSPINTEGMDMELADLVKFES